MSFSCENLENHPISLEDIELATQNFSQENWISEVNLVRLLEENSPNAGKTAQLPLNDFMWIVAKGRKSGYMVIVYEYPVNGTLADILRDPYKGDDIVIHRSITKSNILLDDNLKAKICGFDISSLIPKSDIYSFWVLLFDIMIRRLAFDRMTTYGNDDPRNMIKLVRRCGDHGLDKLIDCVLRDQIGGRSFHIIKEMAYKCITYNMKDRPTLDRIIKSIKEALGFLESAIWRIKDHNSFLNDYLARTMCNQKGYESIFVI
ncbi:protein kinase, ATP binding site-containing protein [Tanacetum coccineum]